jgi:chromosome partitioning protein
MARPVPKTIAVAVQKGGAGKTTTTVHLAVEATRRGRRVVVFDADPQRSAWKWSQRRGATVAPRVIDQAPTRAAIDAELAAGADLVILDTAPRLDALAARVVGLADLVLVPVQLSLLDLDAVGDTVKIIRAAKRPAAFLLNGCPPGINPRVAEMRAALERHGFRAAPPTFGQRVAFRDALLAGQAVGELEPNGKAAAEVSALYKWTMKELSA